MSVGASMIFGTVLVVNDGATGSWLPMGIVIWTTAHLDVHFEVVSGQSCNMIGTLCMYLGEARMLSTTQLEIASK